VATSSPTRRLGGAAAWPAVVRAQQRPATPVIGFLAVGSNGPNRWGASFYQGLKEAGYVERQNVAIEYRGGPPRVERLLELARELVRRQVAVILTSNDGPALAAKRATSTIRVFSDGRKMKRGRTWTVRPLIDRIFRSTIL
jgi:putative ABC transport system substrate-binding protein